MKQNGGSYSKRSREEVLKAPRSAPRSLLKTHRERNPGNFLTKAFWIWILDYLKTALRPRHEFLTYDLADKEAGIYTMPEECVVALASDWGTGTASAYRVRDGMQAYDPDITIHLGDVYYSGKKEEFAEYFLGEDDWPRGKTREEFTALPSYALNANHEMYSGGDGYFEAITQHLGQEASFFCVENDHWRIVGLDSGYYSRILPLLELLPFWITLHRHNQHWLRGNVLAADDDRPIILLSHHQWFSAFDKEYMRLGKSIGADPRFLLWFWGHEHRLAGYGLHRAHDNGPQVRARCIGHGGMPIEEIWEHPQRERNLVFYDRRQADIVDGVPIGYCGFAVLSFEGQALKISYEDENGVVLLEERWVSEPEGPSRGEIVSADADALAFMQPPQALVS